VAFVTYDLELVMQPPHAFGGLDVYCVLFLERRGFDTRQLSRTAGRFFIKLLEGEFVLLVFLKVIKPETGRSRKREI